MAKPPHDSKDETSEGVQLDWETVYEELKIRSKAALDHVLGRDRQWATLTTHGLVSEAVLKALPQLDALASKGPNAFYGVLYRCMKQRIVEYLRYHYAAKRQPPGEQVPIETVATAEMEARIRLLDFAIDLEDKQPGLATLFRLVLIEDRDENEALTEINQQANPPLTKSDLQRDLGFLRAMIYRLERG